MPHESWEATGHSEGALGNESSRRAGGRGMEGRSIPSLLEPRVTPCFLRPRHPLLLVNKEMARAAQRELLEAMSLGLLPRSRWGPRSPHKVLGSSPRE